MEHVVTGGLDAVSDNLRSGGVVRKDLILGQRWELGSVFWLNILRGRL